MAPTTTTTANANASASSADTGPEYIFRYRILGINDDTDTCCACGKTGLKKVVWLAAVSRDNEEGEPMPYGCDCAARRLMPRRAIPRRGMKRIERELEAALQQEVTAEIRAIWATLRLRNRAFVLPETPDEMDDRTAREMRNARYPILAYTDGKITLAQAARYLRRASQAGGDGPADAGAQQYVETRGTIGPRTEKRL